MAGSTRQPLAFPWEALRALLSDKHFRYGLSRLMSYCTTHGIRPEAVDQTVFDRFLQALENESFVKEHKQVFRNACILWNEAAAKIPGWPKVQVAVPNGSRQYAYAWDVFPETILTEVE